MTEKRFTIKPQDDLFGITDNNTADKMNVINGIRTEIEAEWLCDLLNELYEKNEQLKNSNHRLSQNLIKSLDARLRLEKENEQLKQSYKEFEDECQSASNVMSRKQNDLYRENFKLKRFIQELTSNDGRIWLKNGYVYKTDKILKGDLE